MSATMAEINEEVAVNPDAQSAVTDFLDYTEYLPTDLIRSLTLIRQLDETYLSNSCLIHDHTQTYGKLPSLPSTDRPDALKLRSTISHHLDLAIGARESAYAEAQRLSDLTDRHQDRLKSIVAKLHALPKPPSRDPTPQPQPHSSIKLQRSAKKPENTISTRRLTLKAPKGPIGTALLPRPRPRSRPRHRRVTVPGEVLPPYDPDEPLASTEVSDWDSEPPSPQRTIVVAEPVHLKQPPKQRSNIENEHKSREPRETTTYRKPTPPPEDAPIGTKFHPWTHLSEYEMYRLRKKMKKNHAWEPSEIMVRRELAEKGRGWDNYYKARAAAQANGTPFIDIDDKKSQTVVVTKPDSLKPASHVPSTSTTVSALAAPQPSVSTTPAPPKGDVAVRPKTLKRSESRREKEKQEEAPRDAASKAAQEAEAAARNLGAVTSNLKNLFSPFSVTNALERLRSIATTSSPTTPKVEKKPSKKRKLEEATSASPSIEPEVQQKKKQKLLPKPVPIAPDEPVPVLPAPIPIATPTPAPIPATAIAPVVAAIQIPAPPPPSTPAPIPVSTTVATPMLAPVPISVPVPVPVSAPAQIQTPVVQSAGIIKIPLKLTIGTPSSSSSSVPIPQVTAMRPAGVNRVPSTAGKVEASPPVSRPPSRRSAAASVEPNNAPSMRASRRTSVTPAASTRKTPALDTTPKTMMTAASRRSKREAPGTVTQSSQDGGAAVSISKRKHKPSKGNKSKVTIDAAKPELRTDVDGNQELLDPDEERYCICGDVSYGEMICCELDEKCDHGQWFHMECVQLIELPPRTIKWYCPEDRKKLHKGENSNGLVGRGIR